jgi:hypothetical protein
MYWFYNNVWFFLSLKSIINTSIFTLGVVLDIKMYLVSTLKNLRCRVLSNFFVIENNKQNVGETNIFTQIQHYY